MVGQEHVVRALVNALDEDRVHHAFLFTGTRGVGKTSIARIFAKALNCAKGVSSEPCGACDVCQDIDDGRFVDLMEVDAASRTGVDDTRDLLDNVQYSPARGRFKVYLIDEVHMFSRNSFNALLKTLEEPPPHVKFLLATTDPRKLPVTVLSRCLQFNLRRLPAAAIAVHLAMVMEREDVESEQAALLQIARAADGSVRDALSLLDQAVAYGSGRVSAADVADMLGSVDRDVVSDLLTAVADGDARRCLDRIGELDRAAPDYEQVIGEVVRALHGIALRQVVPDAEYDALLRAESLADLAEHVAPEEVQLFYQIALHGCRDIGLSPDPRSAFEMVILRMLAFRPGADTPCGEAARSPGMPTSRVGEAQRSGETRARSSLQHALGQPKDRKRAGDAPADSMVKPGTQSAAGQSHSAEAVSAATDLDWDTVVAKLDLDGVPLQLARHCRLERYRDGAVCLVLEKSYDTLRSKGVEERLRDALARYLGCPISMDLAVGGLDGDSPAGRRAKAEEARRSAAVASIESDPNVAEFKARFGATIVPDSIEPVD